ncbi:peptide ligase PGM1-related protein [Rhodocaloribacter sp.]
MESRLHIQSLREIKAAEPYRLSLEAPFPGSPEELSRFARLQAQLRTMYEEIFPNPLASRTVVVIPSLSMDEVVLEKIAGVSHYEERMLCLLMLLRLPRAEVIYVTSEPIAPTTIDYFLHLLPGIPVSHARKRLHLFTCYDNTIRPLSRKILERPRLLRRIRSAISDPGSTHMTCFNATDLERTMAVRLGIPLYASDPALSYFGTKSGSREVFREAGILLPDGFENLRGPDDLVYALTTLKERKPDLRRAVVKLEEGASGEGNAVFCFDGAPRGRPLKDWIRNELPARLRFEAKNESWEPYVNKFTVMGGVVEEFIEGQDKRSPSMQGRITPLSQVRCVSTHDQVLGGPTGQIFLGCSFPADDAYRLDVQEAGRRVGEVLRAHGVLGRYGVDFVSVPRPDGAWDHYAIEINIRKGGTTHPFLMLEFLTDGHYDPETGLYFSPTGQPCYYYASDNLCAPDYRGLTPEDLIDIAVDHNLHFNAATQQGVFFHLIGALSQYGKLGVLCIAGNRGRSRELFEETKVVLDLEAQAQAEARAPFVSRKEQPSPV